MKIQGPVTLSEMQHAIALTNSMLAASRLLDMKYSTFVRTATAFGVYKPNKGNKGHQTYNKAERYELGAVKNSNMRTQELKSLLLLLGIKEYCCEGCRSADWLGSRLVMELHHVNGDNTDNRIENLQMLCPNCHSQTDTWRVPKQVLKKRRERTMNK